MKKNTILLIFAILAPLAMASAQDYAFKVSGGMLTAPNISSEIVLNKDDPALKFEDYEGKEGYEFKVSVLMKYAEFGYKVQNYFASKEGMSYIEGPVYEEGKIDFDIQTAYAAIYFGDPVKYAGLNMSLGAGSGIAKLTIQRKFKDEPFEIKDGLAYAKEMHYFAALHYGMSDTYGFTLSYTSQTMNTVVGEDFTNDFAELTIDFLF